MTPSKPTPPPESAPASLAPATGSAALDTKVPQFCGLCGGMGGYFMDDGSEGVEWINCHACPPVPPNAKLTDSRP